MDLAERILKAGDLCTAFGTVVSADGRVTFGPSLPVPAVAPRPTPRHSKFALEINGVDFNELMFQYERDGAGEGMATIDVIWHNGTLKVVDQRAERPAFSWPDWTTPPCSPPPGGWPQESSATLPNHLIEELKAAGQLVTQTLFSPPGQAQVLVITATDVDEVIRLIGPELAGGICVVQSRYSAEKIDNVNAQIRRNYDSWRCYQSGQTTSSEGQVTLTVKIVRVLPEIVESADGIPEGLVTITPWLDPIRRKLSA